MGRQTEKIRYIKADGKVRDWGMPSNTKVLNSQASGSFLKKGGGIK